MKTSEDQVQEDSSQNVPTDTILFTIPENTVPEVTLTKDTILESHIPEYKASERTHEYKVPEDQENP